MKADNDNGRLSIDIAETTAAVMANVVRVMRGSGKPELVASSIKQLAGYIDDSEREIGASHTANLAASALVEWANFPGLDGVSEDVTLLNDVIDGSLLAAAAASTNNALQFAKARNSVFSAVARYIEVRRRKEIERLVEEANRNPTATNEITLRNALSDDEPPACFVYFIGSGSAIKIGRSVNPRKRLASLQTAHHDKLELLAVMPGDTHTEANLHLMFAAYRLNGEWFRDCEEIRNYISEINSLEAA